jgi:hypothetical protein
MTGVQVYEGDGEVVCEPTALEYRAAWVLGDDASNAPVEVRCFPLNTRLIEWVRNEIASRHLDPSGWNSFAMEKWLESCEAMTPTGWGHAGKVRLASFLVDRLKLVVAVACERIPFA